MNKYWSSLFLFLFLLTLASAKVMPPINHYVNDFAGVLTAEDVDILRQAYAIVEENTTVQIVFVSVNSTDYDISQYATMIGSEWGVGDEEKDNGVVILYVKDSNKIWVAVGYGVEGVMPDSKIGRFLDEYYVPLRDEGRVSEGIVQFSLALGEELILNREELIAKRPSNLSLSWIVFGIIVVIILFIILSRLSRSFGGLIALPILFPSGRSSYGGGFGGRIGGGSFGGGGFGGGGAGR